MDAEYSITYVEHPEGSAWGVIGQGINEYNAAQAGDDRSQRLCYALQGPDGAIAGGVIGVVYWDWLYVDLMWLPEALRGRGLWPAPVDIAGGGGRPAGRQARFPRHLQLPGPGFYQSHGYRVFGELPGFPAGHTRYFLTKAGLKRAFAGSNLTLLGGGVVWAVKNKFLVHPPLPEILTLKVNKSNITGPSFPTTESQP
jgi:hypothetical protein